MLDRQNRSGLLRLAGGLPSDSLFPLASLAEATAQAAGSPAVWQYATSAGLPGLRAWIADRLRHRGVPCRPEQILITNGSQHALLLAALTLVEPGSHVAVESPGYPGASQALAITGAQLHGVGPHAQELADLAFRRPLALVHRMLNGQNPTGRTLDAHERQALAEVCTRANLTVLEDDAYGELWYDRPLPAPLAALHRQTLLIGSFSKILAPGLRLGWIAAPPGLQHDLTLALQASALHANGLAQATVLNWLQREDLDAHLHHLRSAYRERRDALLTALVRHWPGRQPQHVDCGMFVWLPLPTGASGVAFAEAALSTGVAVVPGAGFHVDGSSDEHLRLCFATESPERLTLAAQLLGNCLSASTTSANA